jgi:hypothetical protein
MRFSVNDGGKWKKEIPCDVARWLWRNDGLDAVAIDDDTNTYYCGTLALIETYQTKWAAEGKKNDKRQALPFRDVPPDAEGISYCYGDSAVWCETEQVLCSEKATCAGKCQPTPKSTV